MPRTKILLALLAVAIVLALVLLPRGRGPVDEATVAEVITFYGYTKEGTPLWEIHAESGRIDGAEQWLHGVSVDFYDEEGPALHVRGAELHRTPGVSRLSGGVRIERGDDLVLETDAVSWDEARDRLEAGAIDLTTPELRVSAARFEYELETAAASFAGGVDASADLDARWTIEADRAEERDGVVTFRGGVIAESEDGASFRCERLEAESESETARLTGGVVGDWASGHLSADSVRFDDDGIHATGGVTARLDWGESRDSDGT